MKKIIPFTMILILALSGIQCSVYQTIVNLSRLQFKLADVNGFRINNIDISGKSKLTDFSVTDALALTTSFAQGKLPVSFVLNVDAKNPNDGTGGYQKTDASLKSFAWRLFLDEKETISGDIDAAVNVPGTGEITKIPLRINLDLMNFFKDRGYESIINLALALGGSSGSSSKIALYAKPTVSTALGNISYPGELKIVDAEFTN